MKWRGETILLTNLNSEMNQSKRIINVIEEKIKKRMKKKMKNISLKYARDFEVGE